MEKDGGAVTTMATNSNLDIKTAQPPHSIPYRDVIEAEALPQRAQHVAAEQDPQQLQPPQANFKVQDPATINTLLQANAVPLGLLARWPATVLCPACGHLSHTSTKYKAGSGTHALAAVFFFSTVFGVVIPYISNSFKNVQHNCRQCGRLLATFHYGLGTEAHLL